MFTAPVRLLVLLWYFSIPAIQADPNCLTYKTRIRPLIEAVDVPSLERIFKIMNGQSILTYQLLPIDNTVWPEITAIKRLVSLSKPKMRLIGETNAWPENNNIKVYHPGPADEFQPSQTYHGGIRYIYNCETLQNIPCIPGTYSYEYDKPILTHHGEQIYIPRQNFVATNGDDIDGLVVKERNNLAVRNCNMLAVRKCGSRQVFYNATSADACFESLQFFSLPEAVVAHSAKEDIVDPSIQVPQSLAITKQYFVVIY